jgi:NAD(P)-dependent dehydrogenase (short-subunit alcohol dehydrogenase family)
MLGPRDATIVNVASVNAFLEPDGAVVDYGAAKALSHEVATLVALLASPRTANVTGSDYVIDGGLIKTM